MKFWKKQWKSGKTPGVDQKPTPPTTEALAEGVIAEVFRQIVAGLMDVTCQVAAQQGITIAPAARFELGGWGAERVLKAIPVKNDSPNVHALIESAFCAAQGGFEWSDPMLAKPAFLTRIAYFQGTARVGSSSGETLREYYRRQCDFALDQMLIHQNGFRVEPRMGPTAWAIDALRMNMFPEMKDRGPSSSLQISPDARSAILEVLSDAVLQTIATIPPLWAELFAVPNLTLMSYAELGVLVNPAVLNARAWVVENADLVFEETISARPPDKSQDLPEFLTHDETIADEYGFDGKSLSWALTNTLGRMVYGLLDELEPFAEKLGLPWPRTIGFEIACWAFEHVNAAIALVEPNENTELLITSAQAVIYPVDLPRPPLTLASDAVAARLMYYKAIRPLCVVEGETHRMYWRRMSQLALDQLLVQRAVEGYDLRMCRAAFEISRVQQDMPHSIRSLGVSPASDIDSGAKEALFDKLCASMMVYIAPIVYVWGELHIIPRLADRSVGEVEKSIRNIYLEMYQVLMERQDDLPVRYQ